MMMAGEKGSSFSRYQPQEEVWRKKWDPNKHSHHHHHHAQRNEIRTNSHEKDSGQEETGMYKEARVWLRMRREN